MTSQLQNEFIMYHISFFRELVRVLYYKTIIQFFYIPLSMMQEQTTFLKNSYISNSFFNWLVIYV